MITAQKRGTSRRLGLLLGAIAGSAALAVLGAAGTAGGAQESPTRSSADGVYTLEQATRGKDVFAGACQSCHTPVVHAGPAFRGKWFGRSLGELFGYLRREMPQTDPGTLSDEEYALVLAYLLRINGMKTGDAPLAADSLSLHRIRLDSVPSAGSASLAPVKPPTASPHRSLPGSRK